MRWCQWWWLIRFKWEAFLFLQTCFRCQGVLTSSLLWGARQVKEEGSFFGPSSGMKAGERVRKIAADSCVTLGTYLTLFFLLEPLHSSHLLFQAPSNRQTSHTPFPDVLLIISVLLFVHCEVIENRRLSAGAIAWLLTFYLSLCINPSSAVNSSAVNT